MEQRLFYLVRSRVRGMDPHLFHPNSHQGFELLYIQEGTGGFIYSDCLYELRPGRLFLINGPRFHYTNPADVEHYVRSGVEFDPAPLLSLLRGLGQEALLSPFLSAGTAGACVDLLGEERRRADGLFAGLEREYREGRQGFLAAALGHLLGLLALSGRSAGTQVPPAGDAAERHVAEVISYIGAHLSDFSLEEMAGSLYLSKFHLCHLFKASTGLTIQGYLQEKRVEAARALLTTTDQPIARIAVELGFGSFSVFSRTFRALVGMTPRDYRKRYDAVP